MTDRHKRMTDRHKRMQFTRDNTMIKTHSTLYLLKKQYLSFANYM